MTKKRTTKELKGGLQQLTYEFNMLNSLAYILAFDRNAQGVIHNALLESFLIHARTLIDFFYDECPYPDDIIAAHFLAKEKWESIRLEKSQLLGNVVKNANKYLAHITYTRLQGKISWPYMKIANEIEAIKNIFWKHLPKEFSG